MNVFFIRHGFSKANATHYGIFPKDTSELYDCELTNIGIVKSIEIGRNFKNPIDYIFCSTMTRAIQTAYYMFYGQPINVINHVKEIDDTFLTQPIKKLKQIQKRCPDITLNAECLFSKNVGSTDFKKFLNFLDQLKDAKNIVVVTHSLYMHKNLNIEIPNNNSIYQFKYDKQKLMFIKKIHDGHII